MQDCMIEPSEPISLGWAVQGEAAHAAAAAWYAAPPEKSSRGTERGVLVSVHRGEKAWRVQEHALPGAGVPAAASLSATDQHILVTCLDYGLGETRPPKALYALEPQSGQVVWQVETPSRELTVPVMGEGVVYFAAAAPEALYAVDLSTRQLAWQKPFAVNYLYRPAFTPQVLTAVCGSLTRPNHLAGFEPATGQLLWQNETEHYFGQPVGGRELVFVPNERELLALHPQHGRLIWAYRDLRRTGAGLLTATPAVGEELLFVPSGAVPGYALYALEQHTGKCRWQFPLSQDKGHILVTPFLGQGDEGPVVVIGDRQGGVYALDAETGQLLWQLHLPNRLSARPQALDDLLLLPTRDGLLHRYRWRRPQANPIARPVQDTLVVKVQENWQKQILVWYQLAQEAPTPGECGRYYRQIGKVLGKQGHWHQAEQAFREADNRRLWAEALERQGRWREAGELLMRSDEPYFAEAGSYFRQAAQQAQAGIPEWQQQRRQPELAALWMQAERCFHLANAHEKVIQCRAEADKWLLRPRLVLSAHALPQPLQQGVLAQFQVELKNVGFGAAAGIHILATGSALNHQTPIPVSSQLPLLNPGHAITLPVSLTPTHTTQDETPLQIEFTVQYQDVLNGETPAQDGPYAIAQMIWPSYAEPNLSGPITLHIHEQGSIWAAGDQVVTLRTVNLAKTET